MSASPRPLFVWPTENIAEPPRKPTRIWADSRADRPDLGFPRGFPRLFLRVFPRLFLIQTEPTAGLPDQDWDCGVLILPTSMRHIEFAPDPPVGKPIWFSGGLLRQVDFKPPPVVLTHGLWLLPTALGPTVIASALATQR